MRCRISIITATYNSASTIHDCLESVSSQSLKSQHIIIDGGSTDKTLDIIKSHPHALSLVSEPDRGIYDAMNKGISLASGDIIGILNSDDYYPNNQILEKVCTHFVNASLDSCYGDLHYVDFANTGKVTREWKSGNYSAGSFYWGWMPPHPTFFVRSSVYEKYGMFNLDLGTAADYELMLRFLVKFKITTCYIPEVLVKMRVGGTSNVSFKNRLKANRMDRKAWQVNGLVPYPWTTYFKPLRKLGQFFV